MSDLTAASATSGSSTFPPAPAPEAGDDERWTYLRAGMDRMMDSPQDPTGPGSISYAYFMTLYSQVYEIETRTRGPFPSALQDRGKAATLMHDRLTAWSADRADAQLQALGALKGESLLTRYLPAWLQHQQNANHVDRLFAYHNRHCVARNRSVGRLDKCLVGATAILGWKAGVFDPLRDPLSSALLALAEDERIGGGEGDAALLRGMLASLVALGIDTAKPEGPPNLELYQAAFETPFIEATLASYEAQASEVLGADGAVGEYLRLSEEWLQAEEARAERFLPSVGRAALVSACEDVLIRARASRLRDAFPSLLAAGALDDLARLRRLLSRVPEELVPLQAQYDELASA